MPNPGENVFRIGRITIDEAGQCRVEFRCGVQPISGDPQLQSRVVMVDLEAQNPDAVAAFRDAVETLATAMPDLAAFVAGAARASRPPRRRNRGDGTP